MTQEVKLRRVQCNYQPENARFILECDFSKQYDRYYQRRLEKTRPFIEFNCRQKWDPNIPIYDLSKVATFGCAEGSQDSDIDSDLGSTPTMFSPSAGQNEDLFCNYKFKKRIRKLSGPSPSPHDGPRTSTQTLAQDWPEDEFTDSDGDEMDAEFTSPIFGAQRMPRAPMASGPSASPISPATIRRPAGAKSAKCIVIGTIFKRMKLQPDVVNELSRGDFHVKCERYLGHYTSQDDTLVLEDFEESIQLVGNINPKQFVTGIVVGLLGVSIDDGSQFMVYDICFAEPNRQLLYDDDVMNSPAIERPLKEKPIYLMLVSGLGFHHEMDKRSSLTRALQDMIDFIWGGARFSEDSRSSRVARILVMGNSLHEDRFSLDEDEALQETSDGYKRNELSDKEEIMKRMKQSRQVKQYTESIQAVKHMDDFFAQLSKTINVDVMPGPSDPSSHLMPQQPFHPWMFPKSCMFSTFNCLTNPHHAIYNDRVELLATAGQNVDIISKFSGLTDPIEIMKCHLLWANSAPSAPDNLYSVPYADDDPYVIDFIPDVYAIGCQSSYKVDYYKYTSSDPSKRSGIIKSASRLSGSMVQDDSNVINVTPDSIRQSVTPKSAQAAAADSTTRTPTSITSSGGGGGSRRGYSERDSYDMQETPKVPSGVMRGREMSAGQAAMEAQPEASSSLEKKKKSRTLLVSVPNFCETLSCVLIDLTKLDSHLLSFK